VITDITLILEDLKKRFPDMDTDWWTMADIARYWGVTERTIESFRYASKRMAPSQRLRLPKEDRMFGRSPRWRPATIIMFQRPGRGTGGGPRKKAALLPVYIS
jgi:hypothetical protein